MVPIAAWGIGARMNLYGLLILRLGLVISLERLLIMATT